MFNKLCEMIFWRKEVRKGLESLEKHMNDLDGNLDKVNNDITEVKVSLDVKEVAKKIAKEIVQQKENYEKAMGQW